MLPVLAAALLAGCGGGSGGGSSGSAGQGHGEMMGGSGGMMGSGGGTVPAGTTTAPAAPGTTAATTTATGAALFRSAGCGSCHRLAAAGTTGSIGPDLDQVHPLYELVVERVTNGGNGMPSFAGSLSTAQIRALARYVAAAAR